MLLCVIRGEVCQQLSCERRGCHYLLSVFGFLKIFQEVYKLHLGQSSRSLMYVALRSELHLKEPF